MNPFNDCSLNFIDSITINQEALHGLFDNENRSNILNLLTAAIFSVICTEPEGFFKKVHLVAGAGRQPCKSWSRAFGAILNIASNKRTLTTVDLMSSYDGFKSI